MCYRVRQTERGANFGVRMLRKIWQVVSTTKHLVTLDTSSLSLRLEKAQWKASVHSRTGILCSGREFWKQKPHGSGEWVAKP